MKPTYIAFTGGCYSGKTTSMSIIKEILEEKGYKVIIFNELIRNHNIVSIDDIRKDPNKYMEVQDNIISGKIQMELELKCNYSTYENNTIVLIDRAVTDSLFYLTFYTHKNGLDEKHKKMFFNLFNFLNDYLNYCTNTYDYVFEFKPIENKTEQDSFRPDNLSEMQNIEYEMIKKYNELYFSKIGERYKKIDLNNVKLNDMKDFWKTYLKDNLNI